MMKTTPTINEIRGIGNDIIEIDRIAKSIETYGNRFLKRIFTSNEISYCKKHLHKSQERFAGRWAAKEAVSKALGCGIGKKLGWKDIEITNTPEGEPLVRLTEKASSRFNHPSFKLSISHCKSYATAVVLAY